MRRLVIVVACCGLVLAGCGGGASPLSLVKAAAAETPAAHTAKMSASIKTDTGPLARGVSYEGGYDFGAHRGRLQFDPSTMAIPGQQGPVDSVFDYSGGAVVYIHLPQLAGQLGGKQWVKIDLNAASKAAGTNIDFS